MDNKTTTKEWYKNPLIIIPAVIIILWLILPQSFKYSLLSFLGGLFSLIFWGAIIAGIIWYIRHRKNAAEAKKAAEKLRMQQPEIELWKKLGATPEERDKNIKKLFDSNNGTIFFGTRWDFKAVGADGSKGNYFMQFRISRNLATMEKREREFLRTTFLLYNNGKLDENQWRYYRFAFINGNGKASIDDYNYLVPRDYGIKDAITMVKYYQDSDDSSVDSAINNLLRIIDNLEEHTNNDSSKHLKSIRKRIHGNGSWLDEDELLGTVYNGGGDYQLSLGSLDENGSILHYAGEGSLITIAPPGSGKTQCFVIPNMLNWKGAAVVLDIKGEIYAATHKWREQNIGKTYRFSPLDPNNSNSYNPLSFVRDDPDYIWEDSRFLADMMIVPSGATDSFWENMARDVLTAAIAHITFNNEADERAMFKVLDILYGIGWNEMIISLKTNVLISAMRRMGNALEAMEPKQRDSVLKTAQSSLSAWQGERIAKVTNRSDWNPLDLRNGTPTIYICINPNEIESYLSVIRVFIAQHIRMLTTELPQRGSAPVLFMLDELPRLKKMPPVDEALNIGRQYGIKLWMFAQSYGQLKDAYPDPEGLIGSCVIRTFMNLPLNDEFTTKISDQLGYRHDALGNTKEKLVEPIELAGPDYRDYILVLASGTKPAKVKKKFAYEDVEIKAKMN
jgi:type IV secretion system protein VirD4